MENLTATQLVALEELSQLYCPKQRKKPGPKPTGRKVRVEVYLSQEDKKKLDAKAEARGVTTSALVAGFAELLARR